VSSAIRWLLPYNTRARGLFRPEIRHMTDVTRILSQIESGDPSAAEKLLPLVYDEGKGKSVQRSWLFTQRIRS
jgi:hypothetical protein